MVYSLMVTVISAECYTGDYQGTATTKSGESQVTDGGMCT